MAKKIKLSPIMSMIAHWQKMIASKSPIDITTLVTRIATHVKALDNAQGHMMREELGNSLFITYPGYDGEVDLPCPRLSLYSAKSYLLQMQKKEPARHSIADTTTRRQTRSSTR
ncbi:hypothetical protein C2845_PM17G04510 [Panicum miliaceum]|uniref:Uncharacterized protein n=1 Tax=Panicum miliaceum TaxID=4540 RepID=A0A3L6PZG1_PANMI|nr:hypothetical protein C2845_PM17G04510 [Panicum miliaceum]